VDSSSPHLGGLPVAVIAMLVPFFNDVVGLLGALGFWPLTIFLPIQMHLKQAGQLLRFLICLNEVVLLIGFCDSISCSSSVMTLQ